MTYRRRLCAIAGLALPGVLHAMLPGGGVAQRSPAECVQEASGEYSMHRECWDGGKRRGLWVVCLPDGGWQEGPCVAGEKRGHWVPRYADGTVEEGAVVERKACEAEAQRARSHAPGTKFRDCPECPEVVAVVAGVMTGPIPVKSLRS